MRRGLAFHAWHASHRASTAFDFDIYVEITANSRNIAECTAQIELFSRKLARERRSLGQAQSLVSPKPRRGVAGCPRGDTVLIVKTKTKK
ncbi:MAG: hypothetical protein WC966_08995 [Bradymonadales bacterium]